MARRETDPEEKRKIQSMTMKVVLAMTAVIVAYVAYAVITKNMSLVVFETLLGIFIVGYMLITDVYEPYKLGMFEEMTLGQREGLMKILALDLVGTGALLYYIVRMNPENGNNMLYPVLIYFLCMQMKRKFRPEFEGTDEEEQDEREEEKEENEE